MNDDPTIRITDMPHDPGSLDGVASIRLDCNDIVLEIEGDPSLDNIIRLVADRSPSAPALLREGDEMVIQQRGRYRGSKAVLRVPERNCPPITGSHDRGEMNFSQINTFISIQHGAGDLRFSGGSGGLDIASGRGGIVCDSRVGDIAAKVGSGDVRLAHGEGAIALSLGRGNVSLDSCTGHILLKTGNGDISVSDCAGTLTVKMGNGDLSISRPRVLRVDTKSGNGDVGIRGGSLTGLRVRNGRGDISSTANLLLSPGDDEVDLGPRYPQGVFADEADFEDDPFGIAALLESKGLEFIAGESGLRIARGPFEFEASDAGVRFGKGNFSFVASDEGVRIVRGDDDSPGKFDVETGKGDITIDVPSNVPTRVETIINSGDVHSDIPLVSVGRPGPKGTTQRLVGVAGSPTVAERLRIKLKTNRGDIRIRSVAQVAPPAQPAPPRPPRPAQETVPARPNREERMRSILDALARGDLDVNEAERMLSELE